MNIKSILGVPLAVATPALLLLACGGSASNAPRVVAEGVWQASLISGGQAPSGSGLALVHPDGTALVQVGAAYVLAGTVTSAGFAGTATSLMDSPVVDGAGSVAAAFTPAASLPPALYTGQGTVGTSPAQVTFRAPDPVYGVAQDLATLAGSYTSSAGQNSLGQDFSFTLAADGSWSGSTSGGATFTGTFALAPGKALAKLNLQITPAGGGTPVAYSGLAVFRTGTGAVSQAILARDGEAFSLTFSR